MLSSCQLKVIGHVAFIMPPFGGVGDNNTAPCVGVRACTCMHLLRDGGGVVSEQWECTVDPLLPSAQTHTCVSMS